jgi:hypothetical protein
MEMYGEKLVAKKETYQDNGRIAIQIVTEMGTPWFMATINLPEIPLLPDEVIIKNYSENEGILDELLKAGIVEETGVFVQVGYNTCPICKIINL